MWKVVGEHVVERRFTTDRLQGLFPSLGHTLLTNSLANKSLSSNNLFMENRSSDFKTYLQEELVIRSQRNPAYSL